MVLESRGKALGNNLEDPVTRAVPERKGKEQRIFLPS